MNKLNKVSAENRLWTEKLVSLPKSAVSHKVGGKHEQSSSASIEDRARALCNCFCKASLLIKKDNRQSTFNGIATGC